LKQGDALSPLLFNFALEYSIRRVQVNLLYPFCTKPMEYVEILVSHSRKCKNYRLLGCYIVQSGRKSPKFWDVIVAAIFCV